MLTFENTPRTRLLSGKNVGGRPKAEGSTADQVNGQVNGRSHSCCGSKREEPGRQAGDPNEERADHVTGYRSCWRCSGTSNVELVDVHAKQPAADSPQHEASWWPQPQPESRSPLSLSLINVIIDHVLVHDDEGTVGIQHKPLVSWDGSHDGYAQWAHRSRLKKCAEEPLPRSSHADLRTKHTKEDLAT